MAGKEANELNTIPSLAASDLIIVYDASEAADEKLKVMAYSDFEAAINSGYATASYVDSQILLLSGTITSNDSFLGLGDTPSGYSNTEVLFYTSSGVTSSPNMTYTEGSGVDLVDHMAIGADASISDGVVLYIKETTLSGNSAVGQLISVENLKDDAGASTYGSITNMPIDGVSEQYGVYGTNIYVGSSNNSGASMTEVMGAQISAGLTGDYSDISTLIGIKSATSGGFGMVSGTINTLVAGQFQNLQYGSGEISVDNAYGVLVKTPGFNPTGTTTNLYGLYVEDQSTVGFTNSYNIYSAGAGKNKFEGDIDFGGTISGTGDIYCNDIYTASGTVHIGDLKLSSTDGSTLLVNDSPISSNGSDLPFPLYPGNPVDPFLGQPGNQSLEINVINGLGVNLNSDGSGGGIASVNAAEFISSVKCWPNNWSNLTYGISTPGDPEPPTFYSDPRDAEYILSCSELGAFLIRVWINDPSWGYKYSETYVLVQDNDLVCP